MKNKELDKKIEEYFCEQTKTPEYYRKLYLKNNPSDKIVRFSPLYLARRDIFYCFGYNPEINEKIKTGSGFGPAYFIGLALIYETLVTVKNDIGISLPSYFKNYFHVTGEYRHAFRCLRHAILHNKYSLIYKDKANRNKILFTLSPRSRSLIKKGKNYKGFKAHYIINPFRYFSGFIYSLDEIKNNLLDSSNIRQREIFNQRVRRKHWVIFF